MKVQITKPCKRLQAVVFDFHGTLSLNTGRGGEYIVQGDKLVPLNTEFYTIVTKINTLKKALRQFKGKGESWYNAMKKSKIDPKYLVPSIDQLVLFTDEMKKHNPDLVFVVASNMEYEDFIGDMLRYVYEKRGEVSPFSVEFIIGIKKLHNYREYAKGERKMQHLSILKKLWEEKGKGELNLKRVVLIDNSKSDIESTMGSVCTVDLSDDNFFSIRDWNKSIDSCNQRFWICVGLLI